MGKKKKQGQNGGQDLTIPDSALVLPNSADMARKSREKSKAKNEMS